MTTRRGPFRLSRLLPAVAGAAILLSGCGSQPFGQPAAGHTGTASPAASPRQRAVADAAAHHGLVSPAAGGGAHRPDRVAGPAGERPATPDLASLTRWWQVPGRPQGVLAWIRAHLPSGFSPDGTGRGNGSWIDTFALPAVPGVLTERELVVLAVHDRGQTAIRVDAQVVWLSARPAAERVPPASRGSP